MLIGDNQINLDQVGAAGDTDRKAQRNLHDHYIEAKSSLNNISRKKTTSSTILNAGGAGGGIRQNAKVIKSKNAFLAGTGPWGVPPPSNKILGNEVSSELGNLIQENMHN